MSFWAASYRVNTHTYVFMVLQKEYGWKIKPLRLHPLVGGFFHAGNCRDNLDGLFRLVIFLYSWSS